MATSDKQNAKYFQVWRWHFYAGMFVAPFLIVLSLTGLGMLLTANTTGRDLDRMAIDAPADTAQTEPVSVQAKAALQALPDSTLIQYIAPRDDKTVALFRVQNTDASYMVAVNPYDASVVKSFAADSNLYHTFDDIHADLLFGTVGDYIQETTAALTILLILSGLYLWWQKRRSVARMLVPTAPQPSTKRHKFRLIHATLGSWVSVVLLFFCISGMAWAGIWGGKVVQSWSQFPAGKWGVASIPMSIDPNAHDMHDMDMSAAAPHVHGAGAPPMPAPTHGEALNLGSSKDVPWVLELTPMPQSGTTMGTDGIKADAPIVLDTVDKFARESGFGGRYQLSLPQGATGVWSMSHDSMSHDIKNPFADRTLHLDRYSGKVLADIRFADYNAFGKFMAAGIALHMGTLGWWSVLANVLFCLAVIAMSVLGYVMWWQRRPSAAAGTLAAPASNQPLAISKPLLAVLLIVACIFPTAIIAVVVMTLLDVILISRVPALKRLLK